jgi:hypothetical protein
VKRDPFREAWVDLLLRCLADHPDDITGERAAVDDFMWRTRADQPPTEEEP